MNTQNEYDETMSRYAEALNQTEQCIHKAIEQSVTQEALLIKNAPRIFIAGKGSNIPSAKLGLEYIKRNSTKAAFIVESSDQLDISLKKDDLVILYSHSWSTKDAIAITETSHNAGVNLIVVTANPNAQLRDKATGILVTYPDVEKLFSRPASTLATYTLATKLYSEAFEIAFTKKDHLDAYALGKEKSVKILDPNQIVVLSAGIGMATAEAVALGLSEGCGIQTSAFDFDSYTHGWWVPHQKQKDNITYIIIKHKQDRESTKSYETFKPFFDQTNSKVLIWDTKHTAIVGNTEILSRLTHTIYKQNIYTKYDLNNPPGKQAIKQIY